MTTRFRPTPYRDLHLGHVWTAWLNHRVAAQHGAEFIVIADDIAYNLQTLSEQSWPATVAARRMCADLAWLGMEPSRLIYSTRNAAQHAEAAEALGISKPGLCADASFMGPMVYAAQGATQVTLYHPWLVLTRVVDDYEARVRAFVRGADLIHETQLYDHLYRQLYGGQPPRQEYAPVVRREANAEKESKSGGAWTVADLRDAGYTPGEIISTLRECHRRSMAAGLRDVVIPDGVLEPETHRTMRFEEDFAARMRTSADTRTEEPWHGDVLRLAERLNGGPACTYCGGPVAPQDAFCAHCGAGR